MSDEHNETPETEETFEVTELDDKELEDVAGGRTAADSGSNGNCGCSGGTVTGGPYDNGNCGCGPADEVA